MATTCFRGHPYIWRTAVRPYIKDWVQLFCAHYLNYPLGRVLSHHKQEASCFNLNNVRPWNVILHLSYHRTERVIQTSTGPNNNAQSCPYLFPLKCDVRRTSATLTLEVVLPSAFSIFQSTHSGFTCTGRSTCQLPLDMPLIFWKQLVRNFPEENWNVPVGFDREEITVD